MAKILAMDPSLSNWGCVLADVDLSTGVVSSGTLHVIHTSTNCTRKSTAGEKVNDYARRTGILMRGIGELTKDVDYLYAELPIGSQDSKAMAGYGITCAMLAYAKSQVGSLVGFSPNEVKLALTQDKQATKKDMIVAASTMFPDFNWPMHKRGGNLVITEGVAEHMADACAVLLLGINHITSIYKGKVA